MISNPFCISLALACFVENFLSVYRKDIGLSFYFFVMSLSGFDIREVLASQNKLVSTPLPF